MIMAEVILVELGADVVRFLDADHAAPWGVLRLAKTKVGRKRRKARIREGYQALGQGLTLAVWACHSHQSSAPGALYLR